MRYSEKTDLIARILSQDSYSSDSGMVCQLSKALMKLSASDLSNLELIVDIKCGDAARRKTS